MLSDVLFPFVLPFSHLLLVALRHVFGALLNVRRPWGLFFPLIDSSLVLLKPEGMYTESGNFAKAREDEVEVFVSRVRRRADHQRQGADYARHERQGADHGAPKAPTMELHSAA